MENSLSRILIETTVRQTLKGLQEDPKRSIRNLVDMALQFSEGRFQNRFFGTAQTMLKNEGSAYYALVQDAASHIETEHLVTFGMNLGYNSCTWGAPGAAVVSQVHTECYQMLRLNVAGSVLHQRIVSTAFIFQHGLCRPKKTILKPSFRKLQRHIDQIADAPFGIFL